MQSGWWWLQDPEDLEALVQALHPRGIREKALHKHLTKHTESLREVCARAATGKSSPSGGLEGCQEQMLSSSFQTDFLLAFPHQESIFQIPSGDSGHPVSQETLAQWSMTERAFEADLAVLQWVEDLEQRVLMADLQIRVSTKVQT